MKSIKKLYNVFYSLNGRMDIEASSEEEAVAIAEKMLSGSSLSVEVHEVVPAHKEGNTEIKPVCKLVGEDGNIFNLLAIARRTLRKAGQSDKAEEVGKRVTSSKSYFEALAVISEYVKIV